MWTYWRICKFKDINKQQISYSVLCFNLALDKLASIFKSDAKVYFVLHILIHSIIFFTIRRNFKTSYDVKSESKWVLSDWN